MFRLLELCAGYGSQALALKKLGLDVYSEIAEFDKYASQAYMQLHGETKNYGDIYKIDETKLPYFDMITYSTPCFTNGRFKATSVSRELIYGLAQCIAKVYKQPYSIYKTERPKTTVIEGRTVNQKDTYELCFKKEKRPQDKAFYEDGFIWFPVTKVEEDEIETVYDLTVEENHSFTVQGVIVHNCQDFSVAGNSIVVDVLEAIFKNLLMPETTDTKGQLSLF